MNKTKLIQIGNSKGVRLSTEILEEADFKLNEQLFTYVINGSVIIVPQNKKPREKWSKNLKQMNLNNDDKLLIPDSLDLETWE